MNQFKTYQEENLKTLTFYFFDCFFMVNSKSSNKNIPTDSQMKLPYPGAKQNWRVQPDQKECLPLPAENTRGGDTKIYGENNILLQQTSQYFAWEKEDVQFNSTVEPTCCKQLIVIKLHLATILSLAFLVVKIAQHILQQSVM